MSSEDLSLISSEPFIGRFVFAIIKSIQLQNFSYEEKQVINADLVPRVSEKVIQSSLKEKEVPLERKDTEELVAPISRSIAKSPIRQRPVILSSPPPRQMSNLPSPPHILSQSTSHQTMASDVPVRTELSQDYGRITPLLDDPVISLIECQGVGKPLMIIRAGQRQITRITLTQEGIKEILQEISDMAHIPLLEGVFRAVVDNFSINAIISEIVGSKFVIRKQTPYSLLERQV